MRVLALARCLPVAVTTVALPCLAFSVHAQALHTFDVPAGPLDASLTEIARQSGVVVSFDPQLVRSAHAPGVSGRLTVDTALRRALVHSGLEPSVAGDGTLTLRRAPPISSLKPIAVIAGSVANATELPAALPGGMTARGGRAGLLGNADVMDLPFSLTSYTETFLRHRQATTIADALTFDPSVAVSQTGGMVDSYAVRGFPIGEGNVGEIAFNGVYGVAPNYRAFTPYIERVEVLKGATGLLYGLSPDGGVGGVINIVPKRAGDVPLTRVTANYAGRSVAGAQIDMGRRFGERKEWGIRVNGSHEQGKTTVDNQKRNVSVGSIAVDYRGDKLRASLDVITQDEHWDAPSRVYSVANGVQVPDAPDGRTNPTQEWGWSTLKDRSTVLDVQYEANENLALFANAGTGYSRVDRLYDQQMVFSNVQGDFGSTPRYGLFKVKRETASAGARLGFDTGPVRHAATVQATTLDVTNYQNSTDGTSLLSNLYAPRQYAAQDVFAPATLPKVARSRLNSLALSDTLSMLSDRVQLIAGARYQRVESDNWDRTTGALTSRYKEGAVTPSAALIFRPTASTMVYGSYIEGLSKGDVAPQAASNAGEMFAPYTSRQYELGVKAEWTQVLATLSAFQITKPSGYLNNGVFGVNGEQRNRGVEFGLQAEPVKGLRLLGGVTWIDAELTQTATAALQGNRPIGVPEWRTTLGAEWDMPGIRGAALTSGVLHSTRQFVNQQNTAYLPSWTRVDLGARYATSVGGKAAVMTLNVQNLFDRNYWSGVSQWGAFALGSGRTVMMSASVEF
jgi:iron complex outermembrane receptor protein